jgi:NAD(P)-dependent dehydrogenase (short-subunit alcohol dehydrogenase family)
MDVDDDDSVRTGVAGMLAAGGRIDALVACAGWGLAGAVEQCTIGEAKAQLETNFWGCVRVVQQVLPAMRAQGGGVHRADELHRRRDRHPVPGFLQREQVRPGGSG